ncbi:MAG: hypothetical protein WCK42_05180 [Myxococcaceae bacterium]
MQNQKRILAQDEREFLEKHAASYDYAEFACGLLLLTKTFEMPPPALVPLVERFGKLASLMMDFFHSVIRDKTTAYPQEQIEQALTPTPNIHTEFACEGD